MPVVVETVSKTDLKTITSKTHFFNWKQEKPGTIYKLVIKDNPEILGLVSLVSFDKEQRVEVKLLSVSRQNFGPDKQFERIAGNLFGFAGRLAVKLYGSDAAISLIPKTNLIFHYCKNYGFESAGRSLFLHGKTLWELLNEYEL